MLLGVFRIPGESVCQEHKQIATVGTYPGFSTFNMATLGFGCSIEIEVIPPKPSSGGGGAGTGKLYPYTGMDHVIIVRIRKDDNVWESEYRTSKFFADQIPKITAWFNGAIRIVGKVSINIKQLGINIKNIFVKGKKL